MVAVALHHLFQVVQVFRAAAQQAVLVHHEHPEPVASVQQFGRGRVVAAPVGVTAHLLQPANAEFLNAVGHGRSHARVVLMAADALDLQVLSVQEETAVRIEPEAPDAEGSGQIVRRPAVHLDSRVQCVEIRGVHRPQPRARQVDFLDDGPRPASGHIDPLLSPGNGSAGSVANRPGNAGGCIGIGIVLDASLDGYHGAARLGRVVNIGMHEPPCGATCTSPCATSQTWR